jgi:hypothetical protein
VCKPAEAAKGSQISSWEELFEAVPIHWTQATPAERAAPDKASSRQRRSGRRSSLITEEGIGVEAQEEQSDVRTTFLQVFLRGVDNGFKG